MAAQRDDSPQQLVAAQSAHAAVPNGKPQTRAPASSWSASRGVSAEKPTICRHASKWTQTATVAIRRRS
jgi:hypothetical protein